MKTKIYEEDKCYILLFSPFISWNIWLITLYLSITFGDCLPLFPPPLSLLHSTSDHQLGVTEAINNYFPDHLPVLFWQLLNGKHMTYWHNLDHIVNKFNSLPLKDRLIQFSSAFLQAIKPRTATGRGALKTLSCIIIWITLGFWIVPLMKLTGKKKKQLKLLKSCKKEL